MKYAASVGNSATSGTTTGIQRINVVSSPVSERLLSEETVMLALLLFEETAGETAGETVNAMKGSLIDVGRSTAWSKDGSARCPNGFDSPGSRDVCNA
jgi:hypothetical protein